MKRIKTTLRILCVFLLAAVFALALALAAHKVYSLYNNLCRKVDYTNNTVYAIHETVDRVYQAVNRNSASYAFDYSWTKQTPPLIAHALGGIDSHTYTNSLEAFEHNYALGHRVFEVDFDLTEEYLMIASHDQERWQSMAGKNAPYTHESFVSARLYDQYTPMDYRDIIDLMIRYPDIYIVTDSKYSDIASVFVQFSQLVKYASETDASVLDRVIPQVYHQDMLHWVMAVHPFKSIILTLYNDAIDPQSAYTLCKQSGIRLITAPESWITADAIALWDSLGVTVAAHTVNNQESAARLYGMGVDLLYTDFLTPGNL